MTFRSLDDYKKNEKKDGEPVSFYAGGEKSGIAVDQPDNNKPAVSITVYSNGFCINDGTFRSFDVEANREYLKSIREGTATQDLAQYAKNGEVSVALTDKSNEKFHDDSSTVTPTEPTLFVGQGRTLGSSTATSITTKPPTSSTATTTIEVPVNTDEPTTTLQFRFHDGTRIRQTFNVTSTVGDVFDFVTRAADIPGGYDLVTGFPGKPIREPLDKSLKECGLLNSIVTQRPSRA